MKLKVYQTLEEIQSIADSWRALCLRSRSNWIYTLPEWHIAWWKTIGQGHDMKIVTVYHEGKIVGILPLCIRWTSWQEGKARILEFSGGSQSDQHDLIVDPYFSQKVLEVISNYFDNELRSCVDVVSLCNIPSDSPTVDWFSNRYHPYKTVCHNPVLPLESNYAGMECKWGASHRANVRRKRRKLEKEGTLALEVICERESASQKLKDFFEVFRRKWELDGNTRGLRSPLMQGPIQQFYQELLEVLRPESSIHFSILTLAGHPISYHFGFLYEGRLYWYRPTYDKAFENFSPSLVHVSMLLELGCSQGWKEFDFLLGAERYKYLWTTKERYVHSLIFRGNRMGRGRIIAWWLGSGKERVRGYLRNLKSGGGNGVSQAPSVMHRKSEEG